MIRTLRAAGALVLLAWSVAALAAPAVSVTVDAPALGPAERAAVRAALAIHAERDHPGLDDARVARLHALAPDQLRAALEAYGWYRPNVRGDLTRAADGTWRAHYAIAAGPPLPVGAVELNLRGPGRDDPALVAAAAAFPLRPGDRLRHGAYEAGKSALARAALDRGYLDARFPVHRVEVDLDAYRARVVLDFDTGVRYRVGTVTFGKTVLRPALLQRFVPFQPGTPYSAADALALQTVLADTPYFASVDVRTRRRQDRPGVVDLEVDPHARKRSRYRVGGGFATDTGPRLTAGYERRYVNDRGHRLASELRLAPVDSALTTTYAIPRANPATDSYEFGLAAKRTDTDTARADSYTAGFARTGVRRGWREALGVDYLVESFETGADEGRTALLMPSARWNRVDAADPVRPRHGRRLRVELRGAAAALGSDVDLVQLRAGVKQIVSLGDRHRLLARADAGTSWVGGFGALPPSLRFYAGGDQSVRGYELDSIGPKDDTGDVIGGRHLAVASAEYELRVHDQWAVATFYDAGNAFDFGDADLRHGAGLGVRWLSPVGPVRLDLARALSDPETPLRVHLTIGPDL